MNIFEEVKFAPEWVKKIVTDAEFVAIIEIFNVNEEQYPTLRDKTEFYRKALTGMRPAFNVNQIDATGVELYNQFGFEAVGAQFIKKYRILWV